MGVAYFAILMAAATIGVITLGGLGSAGFAFAAFGVTGGIAYLIVEGMAVGKRYEKMEEIIAGYTKSIGDFDRLLEEFPL